MHNLQTNILFTYFYYIDTRVLLENIPLVKKLHPGPQWFIFHNLTREFIDDVISVISLYYFFVYIIKKTLHGGLKIWILFSRGKKQYFTHLLCSFVKYCFATRK